MTPHHAVRDFGPTGTYCRYCKKNLHYGDHTEHCQATEDGLFAERLAANSMELFYAAASLMAFAETIRHEVHGIRSEVDKLQNIVRRIVAIQQEN